MAPLLDPAVCDWDTARYFIFSANVFANYIYYSHLFPAMAAILLGFFVWLKAPTKQLNLNLLFIALIFSAWTLCDLILWTTEKTQYTMFFWSIQIYFDLALYVATLYLCYLFIDNKEPSLGVKIIMFAPFVPLWILAHTSHNLIGFDYSNCDREALEGPLWQYVYIAELLIVGWLASFGVVRYLKAKDSILKKEIILIITGAIIFLLAFSLGNITGSLAIDWDLGQYGLFGLPIFLAFLSYLIVQYRGFGVQMLGAQMLVAMMAILIGALLFLRTIESVHVVASVTAVLTVGLGYVLVRSVNREIKLRAVVQEQKNQLEIVNRQQESLLHFVSHEVKGFLTEGQNAFAGIIEGDFGKAPEKIEEVSRLALGKMRGGVSTVMDILDAANLKRGTVTYKKDTFDFSEVVKEVCNDLSLAANNKGLRVTCTIDPMAVPIVGDHDKMKRHVIRNLIDNSIKYTPQGSVDVSLQKQTDKVRLVIKDTGVGITPDDMQHLFTEGGHGKDSIKTNVDSTGYGLFVAKSVVDAHGGKIWAESEGQGKGSMFVVELPLRA